MTDEEIQALQNELETTKTELEGITAEKETLTSEKEALATELETKNGAITELEQTVTARDSEIVTLKQGTVESVDSFNALQEDLSLAVSAYKTAVAQANPGIPGDLITGDTIEVVDQSLGSAKTLVAQVRQSVEADIAAGRIPAGAPPRTPPDLSALSPREKIQYAVGGKT